MSMMVTILCSVLGSSGIWGCLQYLFNRHNSDRDLVVGLAHVRITELALKYLDRGYIMKSEYDELYHYLFEPYRRAGGNGTCAELMERVTNELKIYDSPSQIPKELLEHDESERYSDTGSGRTDR